MPGEHIRKGLLLELIGSLFRPPRPADDMKKSYNKFSVISKTRLINMHIFQPTLITVTLLSFYITNQTNHRTHECLCTDSADLQMAQLCFEREKSPIQHRQEDISESRFTMLLQVGEADQSAPGLFRNSDWRKQAHLNGTLLSLWQKLAKFNRKPRNQSTQQPILHC